MAEVTFVSQVNQLRSDTFTPRLAKDEVEVMIYEGPLGLAISNESPPTVKEIIDHELFWKRHGITAGDAIISANDIPISDCMQLKCFLTSYPVRLIFSTAERNTVRKVETKKTLPHPRPESKRTFSSSHPKPESKKTFSSSHPQGESKRTLPHPKHTPQPTIHEPLEESNSSRAVPDTEPVQLEGDTFTRPGRSTLIYESITSEANDELRRLLKRALSANNVAPEAVESQPDRLSEHTVRTQSTGKTSKSSCCVKKSAKTIRH